MSTFAKSEVSSYPYRSWVEISLSRIAENFRAIRALVGPGVEVMPVVKADAYRHGAVEVSRTLEAEGARWLAVSSADEGIALRDAGIRARILVMADFLPFSREAMLAYQLTPLIHSLEDLDALNTLAARGAHSLSPEDRYRDGPARGAPRRGNRGSDRRRALHHARGTDDALCVLG